jgi:2-furoyl-CoA dehydrogenase FAD binding subunit
MKPPAFDYLRPDTTEEAVATLAQAGDDARILAGGQSLVPILNFRLSEPSILVDISRMEGLDYLRADADTLEVGASVTQARLERWPDLAARLPLVAKAIPFIGHYQTRARGTVCGSLAHADPSSELPLCLATLGGEVVLRSQAGERRLGAAEFQTGMLSTARRDDEMVVSARFPLNGDGTGTAFTEMAQRRGDFAMVAVAAIATKDTIRFGVGGVADAPEVRQWEMLEGAALDDALNGFAWELGGFDDHHATARYRRELVRRLGKRVIEEAKSCRS